MSVHFGSYRPRDAEHTVLYRVIDEPFLVASSPPDSPTASSPSKLAALVRKVACLLEKLVAENLPLTGGGN